MQTEFRARVWLHWAQLIGCGGFAIFAIAFGILFGTGMMTDANGEKRPQAAIPLLSIGSVLLVVAVMAFFNIAGRVTPIIQCFREGIECKIVGASSLHGIFIPRLIRLAWSIFSLQGFRSRRYRINWTEFQGAFVSGIPMAYILELHGVVLDLQNASTMGDIAIRQVEMRNHPNKIAQSLNLLLSDPAARQRLPSWAPTH